MIQCQRGLFLGSVDQIRRRDDSAAKEGRAPITLQRLGRPRRRPAVAGRLDDLGRQNHVADRERRIKRARESGAENKVRTIGNTTHFRAAKNPGEGLLGRGLANSGFDDEYGKPGRAAKARAAGRARKSLLRPELAPKRGGFAGEREEEAGIVEGKVVHVGLSQQNYPRDTTRGLSSYAASCHISIFNLSPSLLFTPRAAEGS